MDPTEDGTLQISPADRDVAIRTMIGEEGTPTGQAGVANVILNRAASKQYGDNLSSVIFAPGQFEPWSRNPEKLLAIPPDSPAYQRAAQIFDGIAGGSIPDLTNGATHFYAPKAQAALGRKSPTWAQGQGMQLGQSLFYSPNGPSSYKPAPAVQAINNATSGGTAAPPDLIQQYLTPAPVASKAPDLIQQYLQPSQPPASVSRGTAPSAPDLIQQYLGPQEPAPQTSADISKGWVPPVSADEAAQMAKIPIPASQLSGASQSPIQAAQQLGGYVAGQAAGIPGKVVEDFKAGAGLAGTGLNDISQGNILPSFPSWNPATWNAGGVLKTAAGTAAAISSPITGAVQKLVQEPVTNATGNPDAGERAGLVANLLAGPKLAGITARGVRGILPSRATLEGVPPAATNMLVNAIASDGPQAVVNKLSNLGSEGMLADAGPSLQGLAQGLAVKPGDAKSTLVNAINDRAQGSVPRINADLNKHLGPAEDPEVVTQTLKDFRRQTDAQNYNPVLQAAAPVDTKSLVAQIDSLASTAVGKQAQALQNLRNMLQTSHGSPAIPGTPAVRTPVLGPNGQVIRYQVTPATPDIPAQPPTFETNAQTLHNIKGELDSVINYGAPGLGVEAGAVARANGSLKMLRGSLNNTLETQVPGYSQANAASAALAQRMSAVKSGTELLNGGNSAIFPETFANQFAQQPPGWQIAMNKGIRGRIEQMVGTAANDPVKLRSMLQGEGGWNTANLQTAFGQEPVNQLVNAVAREGQFAVSKDKIVDNAQTEFRRAAGEVLKDTAPAPFQPSWSKTLNLPLTAANKFVVQPLYNKLATTNNVPRDTALANLLSAQGPQRDALLRQLAIVAAKRTNAGRAAQSAAEKLAIAPTLAGNVGSAATNKLVNPPTSANP